MTFTPEEVAYIGAQRLARVATTAPDGQPDVVPVGFEFDGTAFWISGFAPDKTRRTRNIQAGQDKVALVIDDALEASGWAPRYLRVYGAAELVERDGQLVMKVTPAVSWSFNLDGRPINEIIGQRSARKTVH
jgi:pyridoxamine 5'-phosphate oxidase family protein